MAPIDDPSTYTFHIIRDRWIIYSVATKIILKTDMIRMYALIVAKITTQTKRLVRYIQYEIICHASTKLDKMKNKWLESSKNIRMCQITESEYYSKASDNTNMLYTHLKTTPNLIG